MAKYRASSEVRFAKIFGYRDMPDGRVEIVEPEARIIRYTNQRLAAGDTAAEIKRACDERGWRARSGSKLTTAQVAGLCRPIFAGLISKPKGGYRLSKWYGPIISEKEYEAARDKLNIATEGVEFDDF